MRSIILAFWIVLVPTVALSQVLPRVYLLATGGTIAGRGTSTTAGSNYARAAVSASEIVDGVPELRQYADIRAEQVANVYGNDVTISDWLRLAKRINRIFSDDPATVGIIVTHGTNTLEETAFFLHLAVKDARPVIVVGSQRPGTALSADGPANLLGAVRTVISPDARGKGVLTVMNDEINSARDVAKTNTYRPGTFRTPELGFLGYVDQDRVTFYRDVTRRHTFRSEFDISDLSDLPAVEILYSYIQPSVVPFQALVASGVKGIVFAGPGPASLSSVERAAIQKVTEMPLPARPVLVRASRAGNGRATDAGPEYVNLQTLTADNLSPHKARILLMLALTKTSDPVELRRIFAEY
jgi:L-asparaginase